MRRVPLGATFGRGRILFPAVAAEVRKVGVVGLGTMGAGIAQVCVQAGVETVGREVSEELGERARGRIDHYLSRGVDKGRMTAEEKEAALARLTTTTALAELADCDLVIEAIVEDLDMKRSLFQDLDQVVAPDAVLATNTSALSVTGVAAGTDHPERIVGMHFFNPAPVLSLVEVVRTEMSSEEAVETVFEFARRVGKDPIRCADTPGFVVNRILIPLLNDCVRVLDEAGVTPEDLDKAMTAGVNWPIGPCALIDLIGVDVHVHASEALWQALGDPRMAAPALLVQMRDEGRLGRKAGHGFFRYES
jgi:3-hydroxybutyryl-CoA dehydrogenase